MTELELTLNIPSEELVPDFGFTNLQPVTDERILEINKLHDIPNYNVKRLNISKLEIIDGMIKLQLNTNNDFVIFKDMEDLRSYVYLSIDKVYGIHSSKYLKDTFMEIIEKTLIYKLFPNDYTSSKLMKLNRRLEDYHIKNCLFL